VLVQIILFLWCLLLSCEV